MKRNSFITACFVILALTVLLSIPVHAADNLVANGNFAEGIGNRPNAWSTESWIDQGTTAFTWIPPFNGEQGAVEISNEKLNDTRWIQSTTLDPGLYEASVEILTSAVPAESWAGALISIGEQGVASLDVKGNTRWNRREVFFRVTREHTPVDVKLRLGGFLNFAVGQAFFRNAALVKIDQAPEGAMVLDLDANRRLWAGSPWTLLPVWVLLVTGLVIGWRMLATAAES
jgi:hypothetical protein